MLGRRESLEDLVRTHVEETRLLRKEGEERTRELREFNREILLRNEKVYTSVIAQMEEQSRRMAEGTQELREGREQLRANTKAVLGMLDRMNGTGGTAG